MQINRQKLTDEIVAQSKLPKGKKDTVIWDTEIPGFGLRIRNSTKSYILTYRPCGAGRTANSVKMKLGAPNTIANVKEARRLAIIELGKIAAGQDPQRERKEARRKEKVSVGELLNRYDAYLTRRSYVSRKEVLSLLRRRLAPMSKRALNEIKGWELAELIEKIDATVGGSAGDTFRTKCNTFLNWCTFDARVIDANPLAGYRRRRDTRAEKINRKQYGRTLCDEELERVWSTADPETSFGRIIRFLILTGCRRGEAAKLERAMIDDERSRIDLPAYYTKQARGHTVFISPALADLLASCVPDARSPQYVFPSPRTGRPMMGWTRLLDPSDKRTAGGTNGRSPGFNKVCGVDFRLHDLRRTFRTGLSRLGIDRDVAELALGHAREDLEARYNRDDCEDALRDAFSRWSGFVTMLSNRNEDVFG